MKQTAIQQLMNELLEFEPVLFNVHSERGSRFLNQFHKYLDIEKQQIMDAYHAGIEDVIPYNYYDNTYKSESNESNS